MRTFIRVVISAVGGFFLMWPLGRIYSVLHWPTFNSFGLAHGSIVSAWPTLSIFTFLALGYVRPFPRFEDTPLLIVGVVWGLLLTGFLGIYTHLSDPTIYGLLGVTTAIVAILSFFATHKLRLTLLVLSPIVFFSLQPKAAAPPTREFLPLIFVLMGGGIGSAARAVVRRPPASL
jgi:hypothetical protein